MEPRGEMPRSAAGVPLGWVTTILAVVCGGLALLGGASQALFIWQPELPGTDTLVDLFWVNGDRDVWTWSSSIIELSCAVLLLVIWASERTRDRRFARYWLGLALLFLAMSVDDVAMFHERSERALSWVPTTGVFYFKWTLLAWPFVIVVGLVYLRFLLRLPAWVRWRVILAGGLFVGGAVGLEMVSSYIGYHQGESPLYQANTLLEECAEQAGLIVFIHVLLHYLAAQGVTLQMRFADGAVQAEAQPQTAPAGPQPRASARPATGPSREATLPLRDHSNRAM